MLRLINPLAFTGVKMENPCHSISRASDYIELMNMLSNKIDLLIDELISFLNEIETQTDISIHGIRKRTKFLRALLLLGGQFPKSMDRQLKTVSQILGPYRDAQVNWDSYQSATNENPLLLNVPIERTLKNDPYFIKSTPGQESIDQINFLMDNFKLSHANHSTMSTHEHLILGIQSAFKRGTKTRSKVINNSSMGMVHLWRKKTKILWYQLRLIYGDLKEDQDHILNSAHNLSQVLGEIHDLDMFGVLIAEEDSASLLPHLANTRNDLFQLALHNGSQLYDEHISTIQHLKLPS